MLSNYKPQIAKARSWDEIEEHYIDLNRHGWGHEKLLALVRHIKSTNLRGRLFAYTSMDKLVVSIYDPIEWNREALHIEFDRANQYWYFNYHSMPGEKTAFERKYDADSGIQKFEGFVAKINW